MLLEIVLPGAPFWATASCKYCGLFVANLFAGSLKRPLHPAGDFLRPTLAAILYHIILWVKKIITQYIVVLSDFWPHGAVPRKYGVLRSDGVSERALFVIDKKGVIQAIHVSDINIRPDLEWCATELEKLDRK